MIVISPTKLRNEQKKYLEIAEKEPVVIKRGDKLIHLIVQESLPESSSELPADFHRAISMDEAIIRVEEGMRKIVSKYKNIQVYNDESNHSS